MREKISLDMATRLVNNSPLVLITSKYDDKVDITPIAWHMPINKMPPLLAFEISETHLIYQCILQTRDFAVNIPSQNLLREIMLCGTETGTEVDKVIMSGLTTELPRVIKSPVLKAAMGVLECEFVEDRHLLENYNIILGEVKYAEVEPAAFKEHWLFRNQDLKTVHHLGDMTFSMPGDDFVDLR